MGKYRTLGTFFDRVFRNDLNANFNDIDTDVKAQKARVDNLITATPQPAEVVDLRTDTDGVIHGTAWDRFASDSAKTGGKFAEVDAQLAENAKYLGYSNGSYKYNGAVVTIIDDDAFTAFLTKWKPLADEKGIKISIGVVTGNTEGNANYMSLSQLKSLQSEGHDLLNHAWGFLDTRTVSEQDWENECLKSREVSINNGFSDIETIVYSGGFYGTYTEEQKSMVKNVTRKYFKYALNSDGGANGTAYDVMCMNRQPIDNRTLAQVKSVIDAANTNKTWLILYTHSGMYWQEQNIRDIIDYVKSLNIPILPYSKAKQIKGYDLFTGDFTDTNKTYLFKDGTTNLGGQVDVIPYVTGANLDSPITAYPQFKFTRQQIDYRQDNYFNKGGVLETYRGSTNFSYQNFYAANDRTVARRIWNDSTDSWGAFTKELSIPITPTDLSTGCENIINVPNIEILTITNITNASEIRYLRSWTHKQHIFILNAISASDVIIKHAYVGSNDGRIFNKSQADIALKPYSMVSYKNINGGWYEV